MRRILVAFPARFGRRVAYGFVDLARFSTSAEPRMAVEADDSDLSQSDLPDPRHRARRITRVEAVDR